MPSILNATTTNGLVTSADNSGSLQLQTNNGTTAVTIDTSQNVSVVGNLSFNSGYGSSATAYGCRAWVNFNGTGTVAIRGSGNVTSITDNGTGDYTVNFTTAMPDINYSAVATAHNPGTASAIANFAASPRLSGSARLVTYNDSGGTQDCSIIDAAFFR